MRIKTEWDYSSLISGDLDRQIEEEKRVVKEKILGFVEKWRDRKDYLENADILKEALGELDFLMTNYGTSWNVGQYLFLDKEKKQLDEDVRAKFELVKQFDEEMSNLLIFFALGLAKIPEEKQKEFLDNEGLKKYRHYLERIFRNGKYMLSEDVEKVLNLKSGPAYNSWLDMLSSLLSGEERVVWTGEKVEKKGFSELLALLDTRDSRIGDSCFDALNDIFDKFSDIAVAQINAILKNKRIDDELRGFVRADEARIVGDDLDFEFVDDLIEAVVSRFDISNRFYELKAKLFGKEKLKYYERVVSYGDVSLEFDYEEAVKVVGSAFGKMDSEFGDIFRSFVEEGSVDVYPAKGKRQGAFCSWGLKVHPTRILLNYMDRFQDVVTLAHEAGHGLNHELMKKQTSFDFGVPIAVAEVASNFAEGVVFEDVLSDVESDEEKLVLLISRLGDSLSSIHRQIACYKFEQELHKTFREKGSLSKEEINEMFHRNMKAYMGDFVEHPKSSFLWWVYWHHIRDYFYVYSYASGSLIADVMLEKYKEDKDFVLKIKEFLSMGSSRSPRDCFESLGIKLDKDFWMKGLSGVENRLNEAWRLAEKLGKI